MHINGKKGFTLLEVLVVVLIAVIVTLFAVPAYQKSQDKNRYLAASSVLMDLGNVVRMTLEEYPNVSVASKQVTNVFTVADLGAALNTVPTSSNIVTWMFQNKYFNEFPLESSKYMKYKFYISTTGNADCSTSGTSAISCKKTDAIACMSGDNLNAQYTCAWVDKAGNLHHN